MNRVEHVLYDEVTGLLDRLATTVPGGSLAEAGGHPLLRSRLEQAETDLAAARDAVIDGYGRWRRALEDVENLWALAAWRSAAAEEASEQSPALAA